MNIADLLVLGALDIIGPASGYDINKYLMDNKVSNWTEVKKASLYNAIKSLAKAGKIDKIAEERSGNYPLKRIYQINTDGRQYFDTLQAEAFLGLYPKYYGFKLALKLNKRRDRAAIQQFASQACSHIDEQLANMDDYLASLGDAHPQFLRHQFFIEHDRRLLLEEKQWIHQAIDNLTILFTE